MASSRVLLVFVLICGICIEGMSGLTCRICKSQSSRRSTGADNAEEIRVRSIGKHHKESDDGDSQSGSLTTTSPSEESSDASESVSEDAGSSQSESNSTSQESEAESDNRRQESSASSVDDDNDESVSEDAGSSESGTNSTSQEDVGSSENGSNSTSQESEAESDYRRQESSSSSDAVDNGESVSEDGSSESGTNSSESTSSSTEEPIVGDFVRRQDPDANVTVNGTSPVGNFTDVGNATSADGNSSIIDPGGDYSNLTESISVPAPGGGGGCMLLPQPGSPASNATDDVVDGGNSTGDVNTTAPDFDFGGNSTGDVNTTAPDFDFGGNSTGDVNTTAPDFDFGGNSTADVNTTAPDFEGNSTAGGSNASATNSSSDTGDSGVSTNTSEPDPAIYPTPAGIFVYEIYRRDDEDDEDDDGDDDGEEDCEDDVIIAEGEQCFAMITKQGDGIVETYGSQGSEACSTNEGLNDIVTCGDPTLMAEGQTCTLCCNDEDNCNRNY